MYDDWLRLADQLQIKEPLESYMQTISHREFQTRIAFLNGTWENPSRSDHYLMTIAHAIQNVLRKNSKQFKPKEHKLTFKAKLKKETAESAKSRWFGFLRMGK